MWTAGHPGTWPVNPVDTEWLMSPIPLTGVCLHHNSGRAWSRHARLLRCVLRPKQCIAGRPLYDVTRVMVTEIESRGASSWGVRTVRGVRGYGSNGSQRGIGARRLLAVARLNSKDIKRNFSEKWQRVLSQRAADSPSLAIGLLCDGNRNGQPHGSADPAMFHQSV